MMPANEGAGAEVPKTVATKPVWHEPSEHRRYGSWPAAVSETSGRSRAPSVGIPVTPDCHEGLLKIVLAPPPPARILALAPHWAEEQLWFQTFSGIYDFTVRPSEPLTVFQ